MDEPPGRAVAMCMAAQRQWCEHRSMCAPVGCSMTVDRQRCCCPGGALSAAPAAPATAARTLAIIGDAMCDLSATGLTDGLPEWGGDRVAPNPIEMLPGGSGLNSAVLLAAIQVAKLATLRAMLLAFC